MVLPNANYLNTFVSPEKLKGQPVRFYYNYLKCVWITTFFRLGMAPTIFGMDVQNKENDLFDFYKGFT